MATSPEAQSTTRQAQSDLPLDDYRDQFLTILHNRGKFEKWRELPIREQGFVVLARDALDLTPLQTLCADTRPGWNTCLTVRYRLRPGAIFGTLLAAFLTDLHKVREGRTGELVGDFSPGATDAAWKEFPNRAAWETFPKGAVSAWEEFLSREGRNLIVDGRPEEAELLKTKQLETYWLEQLLRFLSSDKTLLTGERLVLFAEVDDSEAFADKQE